MLANGQFPGIRQIQPPGTPSQPRQRKQSIMYGKAKTGKDGEEELLAADVALVASGVSKDATAEQLKEFIGRKGIHVVEVEKLTKDDAETRTNTFKVLIKTADYEKLWTLRYGLTELVSGFSSHKGEADMEYLGNNRLNRMVVMLTNILTDVLVLVLVVGTASSLSRKSHSTWMFRIGI